mmetsp:Transcript_72486/g.201010  ORF Transcript_72486/g.201010 Transcript_72486/m.201010 type:complete len:243 (+) Transcript_72486:796-1524(+)
MLLCSANPEVSGLPRSQWGRYRSPLGDDGQQAFKPWRQHADFVDRSRPARGARMHLSLPKEALQRQGPANRSVDECVPHSDLHRAAVARPGGRGVRHNPRRRPLPFVLVFRLLRHRPVRLLDGREKTLQTWRGAEALDRRGPAGGTRLDLTLPEEALDGCGAADGTINEGVLDDERRKAAAFRRQCPDGDLVNVALRGRRAPCRRASGLAHARSPAPACFHIYLAHLVEVKGGRDTRGHADV